MQVKIIYIPPPWYTVHKDELSCFALRSHMRRIVNIRLHSLTNKTLNALIVNFSRKLKYIRNS